MPIQKTKFDDVPGPVDRGPVAPDADARRHEVGDAGHREATPTKQAVDEAPPPPDRRLLLGDPADLVGDPGEAPAVADQRRARLNRGPDLVEDRGDVVGSSAVRSPCSGLRRDGSCSVLHPAERQLRVVGHLRVRIADPRQVGRARAGVQVAQEGVVLRRAPSPWRPRSPGR